jgi:hypothetical protein
LRGDGGRCCELRRANPPACGGVSEREEERGEERGSRGFIEELAWVRG